MCVYTIYVMPMYTCLHCVLEYISYRTMYCPATISQYRSCYAYDVCHTTLSCISYTYRRCHSQLKQYIQRVYHTHTHTHIYIYIYIYIYVCVYICESFTYFFRTIIACELSIIHRYILVFFVYKIYA